MNISGVNPNSGDFNVSEISPIDRNRPSLDSDWIRRTGIQTAASLFQFALANGGMSMEELKNRLASSNINLSEEEIKKCFEQVNWFEKIGVGKGSEIYDQIRINGTIDEKLIIELQGLGFSDEEIQKLKEGALLAVDTVRKSVAEPVLPQFPRPYNF